MLVATLGGQYERINELIATTAAYRSKRKLGLLRRN
jgi:hypothetical protein